MGFFDALFGGATNHALDQATSAANAATQQTVGSNAGILNNAYGQAQGALNTGANSALGSLVAAYGQGANALTNYGGQAQNALQGGVNSAVGTVEGSNRLFQPYYGAGSAANTMLANSLGLNGVGGNAAAQAAFQAGPGYQWSVDQATDAAARKAASLGMAASGNTLDAITRLSSNLADQRYGQWQSGLSGLAGTGLSAAGAMSGNNQAAAGYQYGGGTNSASLFQQLGSLLNTNSTGLGTAQANVQNGLGTNLANLNTGLGSALTNNSWAGTNAINNASLQDAAQSDKVNSYNNGILSNLLGGIGGSLLGGTASGRTFTNFLSKL